MIYVFKYVGPEDPKDKYSGHENRFFHSVKDGIMYTTRGALHAMRFYSEVTNIEDIGRKLGKNYLALPLPADKDLISDTTFGFWNEKGNPDAWIGISIFMVFVLAVIAAGGAAIYAAVHHVK